MSKTERYTVAAERPVANERPVAAAIVRNTLKVGGHCQRLTSAALPAYVALTLCYIS
jgi:hypothetical protein